MYVARRCALNTEPEPSLPRALRRSNLHCYNWPDACFWQACMHTLLKHSKDLAGNQTAHTFPSRLGSVLVAHGSKLGVLFRLRCIFRWLQTTWGNSKSLMCGVELGALTRGLRNLRAGQVLSQLELYCAWMVAGARFTCACQSGNRIKSMLPLILSCAAGCPCLHRMGLHGNKRLLGLPHLLLQQRSSHMFGQDVIQNGHACIGHP